MTASIYRTDDGRREIRARYRRMRDDLDAEFDEEWVETRFGRTHVLATGPEDAPPLVVFHGGNVVNPVSLEWFLPLADDYRLYAPDTVGHPGLSAETRVSPAGDDYGKWVVDVLDGLDLDRVPMVGPSYGAGIVVRTAAYAPERIEAASLVVPSGIASGSVLRMVRAVVVPMLVYRAFPTRERLLRALQPMFSEPADELDPELVDLVGAVFRHVKIERVMPAEATAAELADFRAPTQVVAAENDVFFPAEKVIPRAREVFPNVADVGLLADSGHFPAPATRVEMVERIAAFLGERAR
ncbi:MULTISPECIES: alpha/beta fold hydrolase [Halorussus]|uniref:alpha/beta fold hydrolase n=1 Tax=Halorussus TaxID=1070314 RepID=UPI0020A14754|nr:alpha/beta fold hydrolase [Halorussus vallis]USZ75481.1 alpha/beta fold hydrolase [Halorussus vallis]